MNHDENLVGVALDRSTDRTNHKDCLVFGGQEGWEYGNKGDLTQFPTV
jgi:hypothetical protein